MKRIDYLRRVVASFIAPQKNSLGNEFLRRGNRAMEGDWTQVIMRPEDQYTGYSYAVIKRRANKVARVALENLRTKSEVDDFLHPYLPLIWESRQFSEHKFWRDISTYLDLKGVYYLMAVRNSDEERFGDIQEFKLINPYNIRRILKDGDLEVAGYIETRRGMIREIPKEMIIEIRELNPFDEDKEFSMADAAKDGQFTLKTASDYTRHSLKHNINAPGIMSTDVILPPEQFENFKARVMGHTKGEPIFSNGNAAKWEGMNIDLSKSALQEITNTSRELLFTVGGESKTTMGIEESGTTRDTARIQKELNMEDQIIPRIQTIIDTLNLDYAAHYEEFDRNKAYIIVDNPLEADHTADKVEAEAKTIQFDLYDKMLKEGYDSEKSAKYVAGEIDLEDLETPRPQVVEENQTQESGLVQQQQGALKNAIVGVEGRLVAAALNRLEKQKNQYEDLVSENEKKKAINELALILAAFYGVVINLKGREVIRDRSGTFALTGNFTLSAEIKTYIKQISSQGAQSHVSTVTGDVIKAAQQAALEGLSVPEIKSKILAEYSSITDARAQTIARTETNRAFSRAQFEADKQFINQNNLQDRAFKQWRTRSENPCEFCLALEAEGPIPFDNAFRELGGKVTADDKTFEVNYEELEAGNLHPRCNCIYELVIKADNSLEKKVIEMEKRYEEMDKRTREAKKLMNDIQEEREKLHKERQEFDKQLDELNDMLDE
jgi:hypothetical protein